jgi:uncharacterized cupin superfamily protein
MSGWHIANARDVQWHDGGHFGVYCGFQQDTHFDELGFGLGMVLPGQPIALYHREDHQEGFLVLSGEALLIVEGEERPLKQWDFVHCPPKAKHVIVGAGDGSCLVLAVGARDRSVGPDWGGYTVDETAQRYDASVLEETTEPEEAYARFPKREPSAYREGWLPE